MNLFISVELSFEYSVIAESEQASIFGWGICNTRMGFGSECHGRPLPPDTSVFPRGY